MTKLEEIARAIAEAPRPLVTGKELSATIGRLLLLLEENGYLHEGEWEILLLTIARAAVEALRVPPIEAPAAWEWRPTMDEAWRVYIDAILNEKPHDRDSMPVL